eukprot:6481534-Amphidinium_carterae.4
MRGLTTTRRRSWRPRGDASHSDYFPGCPGCEVISTAAHSKECDNYYDMSHSAARVPENTAGKHGGHVN